MQTAPAYRFETARRIHLRAILCRFVISPDPPNLLGLPLSVNCFFNKCAASAAAEVAAAVTGAGASDDAVSSSAHFVRHIILAVLFNKPILVRMCNEAQCRGALLASWSATWPRYARNSFWLELPPIPLQASS
jgi:hypothetical protein